MNQNSNSTPPSSQDLVENQNLKPSPMPLEQTVKREAGQRKTREINLDAITSKQFTERFFSYVEKKDSGCWEWIGAREKTGYGMTTVECKKFGAHRISFVMHGGIFTDEKNFACHHCDNPCCVNPEHLFAGSHQDNSDDCVSKNRTAKGDRHNSKTHPERIARGERHGSHTQPEKWSRGDNHYYRTNPEKVPKGETHPNAKLSDADVDEIRGYAGGKVPYKALRAKFGISNCHIWRLVNNLIRPPLLPL